MNKTYLGDGVYARTPIHGQSNLIILTVEDGTRTTNTIYLEPDVLHALLQWLKTEGLV